LSVRARLVSFLGFGQVQVVEEHRRLALVHPVQVGIPPVHQHGIAAKRRRLRLIDTQVCSLPATGELPHQCVILPLRQRQKAPIAAEDIVQRPTGEPSNALSTLP